jgi:hypothetical protein
MRNALLVTSVHPKETNFTSETRGRGRTAENFKILSARSPRLSASAAKALALFLPKVFCSALFRKMHQEKNKPAGVRIA